MRENEGENEADTVHSAAVPEGRLEALGLLAERVRGAATRVIAVGEVHHVKRHIGKQRPEGACRGRWGVAGIHQPIKLAGDQRAAVADGAPDQHLARAIGAVPVEPGDRRAVGRDEAEGLVPGIDVGVVVAVEVIEPPSLRGV